LCDVIFDEGGQAPVERVSFEHNDANEPLQPQTTSHSPNSTSTAVRPKRNTHAPTRDDDNRYTITSYSPRKSIDEHTSVAQSNITSNLKTYAEAMSRPDAAQWEMACADEMRAFEHMGVYEVVLHPAGQKTVGSKWVFCIKRRPTGEIQKYKARIMAQGFTQIEGIDYDKTFAPVAKLTSIRTILAIAAKLNLEVQQMDIKSAYLNAKLEEEIYMAPPPGLDMPDRMVLRLVKAVYGMKQGGQMWYQDICATLEEMGYTHLESDHAVFIRVRDGTFSIIALYVDNISMASNDLNAIEQDKVKLKQKYQMTDLGDISWILSMRITHDCKKGTIAVSQQQYTEDVLQKFSKADIHPISTPALANEHLIKLDSPKIDTKSYQRAVGALMYLTLGTRPNLSYAIGVLGRYSANPGPDHQCALDRVFKYLRATSDCGLVFQRGTEKGLTLEGYADADWASNLNDRWSTLGYVFMLASAAVSWSLKKQTSVALSSTKAKYISGAHAAKELIWLRQLLARLSFAMNSPMTLLIDNQSAIAIAKNPAHHERTKHIEVRYHFLKKKVEEKEIELKYVPTTEQPTDTMTKGLSHEKHELFVGQMGLRRLG
jgi:Reverse transcriptase (RNA-dependent DNA polymerase)